MQNQFEDAVSRKAFAECGPLQDRLDELTKKQAELPTVEELRESLRNAEASMALAARNRDFAGAASAKAKVDAAKKRLSEALEAEEEEDTDDTEGEVHGGDGAPNASGYGSRSELEADIAKLSVQIENAVNAKNFTKASMLQDALADKENIRRLFPR